jgi:hypothetical protein
VIITAGALGSGRFWHDRRPRPEYPLPWMREQDPGAARKLWDDLAAATPRWEPGCSQPCSSWAPQKTQLQI